MTNSFGFLIVAHNQASFVKQAIQSVDVALDDDDELLIVVFKSSDDSLDIVRSVVEQLERPVRVENFEDPPFSAVRAIQFAVRTMNSEMIGILSGDDWIAPEYRRYALAESRHPTSRRVRNFQLVTTDECGKPIRRSTPRWSKLRWLNSLLMFFENPGKAPGAVLPRRLILESDFMKVDSQCLTEDYPLWLSLRKAVNFETVHKPVVFYRQHSGSLSRATRNEQYAWSIGYCVGFAEAVARTWPERAIARIGRQRWYQHVHADLLPQVGLGCSVARRHFSE